MGLIGKLCPASESLPPSAMEILMGINITGEALGRATWEAGELGLMGIFCGLGSPHWDPLFKTSLSILVNA